jgi:hypothetical protein
MGQQAAPNALMDARGTGSPSAARPNPFLATDAAPSQPRGVPQPPPSQPQQAPYSSVPRSTVSGVETQDFDEDEDLAFGKNRRKKLVRWLTVGIVVLVAGVTWAVVSSQLRARDPVPDAATAPPPAPTSVPQVFDPTPPGGASSSTPTSSASTKPTGKPKATTTSGQGPVRAVPTKKRPSDGSVELPTPGDDLPPPAP